MTDETATEDEFVVSPMMEGLALEVLELYADYKTCAKAAENIDFISKEWGSPKVIIDAQRAPAVREEVHTKLFTLFGEIQAANAHLLPEPEEGRKVQSNLHVAKQKLLIRMDGYLRGVAEKEGLESPPIEGISALRRSGEQRIR